MENLTKNETKESSELEKITSQPFFVDENKITPNGKIEYVENWFYKLTKEKAKTYSKSVLIGNEEREYFLNEKEELYLQNGTIIFPKEY